jgi:hypothetical protein
LLWFFFFFFFFLFFFFFQKSISVEAAVRADLDLIDDGDEDFQEVPPVEEMEKEHGDLILQNEITFEGEEEERNARSSSEEKTRSTECFACGREGHTWATCRVRSIERILAFYGVLELPHDYFDPRLKEEVSNNPPKAKPKQKRSLKTATTSTNPNIVPPSAQVIPTHILTKAKKSDGNRKGAAKKRTREDPNRKCNGCDQDFYNLIEEVYNWRLYGAKCDLCAKFYCTQCQTRGIIDSCCSNKQKK